MDPLSITASIVTFIDVAKRIKGSVDKVSSSLVRLLVDIDMDLHKIGQNRQTLKELMNDVLDELTELRKLCQHREGELDRASLDYDAVHSLEGLESSVLGSAFVYNLSYAYDTQGTEQGPAALY